MLEIIIAIIDVISKLFWLVLNNMQSALHALFLCFSILTTPLNIYSCLHVNIKEPEVLRIMHASFITSK